MKSIRDERIISVMNTAFGVPESEDGKVYLPFDLRHKTWPIPYHLEEGADQATRQEVKKHLVRELKRAIEEVLKSAPVTEAALVFTPLQPKSRVSSFLDDGDLLGTHLPWRDPQRKSDIHWQDGPQFFIRLIPQEPIPEKYPLELLELIEGGSLRPFGRMLGIWIMGNEYGAVAFESTNDEKQNATNHLVQLTERGEIWAIDGQVIQDPDYAVPFFELIFANALAGYLRFAKKSLGVMSYVTAIAGMTGVQGRMMYLPNPPKGHQWRGIDNTVGPSAKDDIYAEISDIPLEPEENPLLEVPDGFPYNNLEDSYVAHAYEYLMPLFEKTWGTFQAPRPKHLPFIGG